MTRATGLVVVDQRAQLVGDRGVDGCMTSRASPGPWVVRSGGLPSEGNRTISAISARNASSERSSSPSSATTISGERDSVRVVS